MKKIVKDIAISLDEFKEYVLDHDYDENMFNENGSINPKYNSHKKTGLIAKIYEDHIDEVYEKHKESIDLKRPYATKEIQKVIDCANKNLGCSVYECPNCGDFIFVGHTCKSRACSSCGYKYKNARVVSILNTAYNCKHRQIVFTMDKILWPYFYFPYERMINILFKAVRDTIYSIFNETYKYDRKNKKLKKYISKVKRTPGFFAFLHTFGRDLKWNPHIHVLIAELELCSDDKVRKHEYFNYEALRKRFQKILLDLMEKEIGPSFKKIKAECYKNDQNGFYVYAEKKEFKSFKAGVEYVTRYCGRAPISENRIINYDGKNVTFCYNDHQDESYHEVTVTAEQFILILINHMVPNEFKIIRYYGFYRKKHKIHNTMKKIITNEVHKKVLLPMLTHFLSIMKSFKRNPYNCPKCDTTMNYVVMIM